MEGSISDRGTSGSSLALMVTLDTLLAFKLRAWSVWIARQFGLSTHFLLTYSPPLTLHF